jgi:cytochrome P450
MVIEFCDPGKNPRVTPPEGTTLCGKFVPGGTVFSMSAYTYHHDPAYFSIHPHDGSRPERRLKKEDAEWNEKFWFPFGRGSRNCLGQNLPLATLYKSFAYLFRNFELALFETTKEDMDWHDGLLLITFGHLKVKGKKMRE